MGLETAAVVMAAVSAGAGVLKMGAEAESAAARSKALELQANELKLQHQQKTMANYEKVQRVLEAQEAAMTVRGVAFSSSSFNAIQRATFNVGSKNQENIDTEYALGEANIEAEKNNVRNTLFAQLFGDVASIAMSGASLYRSAPSASNAPKKLPKLED